MLLTTWFIVFTRSGQACELNDIKSFSFMMDIACHPLKDPSLRIPVVASNMKSGIELKQQFFVLVLLVSDELQQTSISETIQCFFKAGQSSYSFRVEAHMWKYAPLIV